jgi:hypothetical protein
MALGSSYLAGEALCRFFLLNKLVLMVSHLFVYLCAFSLTEAGKSPAVFKGALPRRFDGCYISILSFFISDHTSL